MGINSWPESANRFFVSVVVGASEAVQFYSTMSLRD